MITKTPYEEFFRYYDFTAILNSQEQIATADVSVVSIDDEDEDCSEMIDSVSPYNNKFVKYQLMGGEKHKNYLISVKIVTSNGQKFENQAPIELVVI